MIKINIKRHLDKAEDPNPTVFVLGRTTYDIGTVFDPGSDYALVICQNGKIIASGKKGQCITLNKRQTKVRKKLFKRSVEDIRVFAVKIEHIGSFKATDWKDWSSHKKQIHQTVTFDGQGAYCLKLSETKVADFVANNILNSSSFKPLKEWGNGDSSPLLDHYVEVLVKNAICKYYDHNPADNINDLVAPAAANTSGPAYDKYMGYMHKLEKEVFKDLSLFENAGKKPFAFYISWVQVQ